MMDITIPSWALPLVGSAVAFVVAFVAIPEGRGAYDFTPLIGCVYLPLAACVSLVFWLVWALS